MSADSLNVTITGGGGRIAYSLIPLICDGSIFGLNTYINLKLLDIPGVIKKMDGIKMEIEDSNFQLLKSIEITSSNEVAFRDSDVVVLLGGYPRLPGMERKDLIQKNVEIIKDHALAINTYSKKTVKVIVVANPANTNALVASKVATSIPSKNFSCLTRLDEERLKNFISSKIKEDELSTVTSNDISNVFIFGNHSATQVPITESGLVSLGECYKTLNDFIDQDWVSSSLSTMVQQRGAAVMNAQGASSAMSAANAIAKHLKDWIGPIPQNQVFSMGILSENNPYDIPKDIFFSFPCRRLNSPGDYEIVSDIKLSSQSLSKINLTVEELLNEKNDAVSFL